MSDRSENSSSGCGCGCVGIIFGVLFIWALLFGVTINGTHYGLSGCSQSRGVEIDSP